jgi:hypothetical protein
MVMADVALVMAGEAFWLVGRCARMARQALN